VSGGTVRLGGACGLPGMTADDCGTPANRADAKVPAKLVAHVAMDRQAPGAMSCSQGTGSAGGAHISHTSAGCETGIAMPPCSDDADSATAPCESQVGGGAPNDMATRATPSRSPVEPRRIDTTEGYTDHTSSW
jgi:hypothetical protein